MTIDTLSFQRTTDTLSLFQQKAARWFIAIDNKGG